MEEKNYYTPKEMAINSIEITVKKAETNWWRELLLAFLAGLFIGLAANGASIAGYSASSAGIGKMLSGLLFTSGLVMVLLAGAELFTGNCLVIIGVLEKRVKVLSLLRNWTIVFVGNFIGGAGLAFAINRTTQLSMDNNELAAYAINTALGKCTLSFENAFIMGILCNILVCVAVWISWGAKDFAGKVLGLFLPIWVFITSGYEHCVANMYYIPTGILAKSNNEYVAAAIEKYGISLEQLEELNWSNFFIDNLIPVTLGNIIGGLLFIGVIYWCIYIKKDKNQ